MTKEEKQLLLIDLCARLPYGIVINTGDKDLKLDRRHQCIGVLYPEDCSDEFNKRNNNACFYITISGCYYGEEVKPYLRPMSSMTDDERFELSKKTMQLALQSSLGLSEFVPNTAAPAAFEIDYYNTHHLDYRGLIDKGLALEAPEGMYN